MTRAALLMVLSVVATSAQSESADEMSAFQPVLKVKLAPSDRDGVLIFKAPNYPEPFYLAFGRVSDGDPVRSDVLLPSRGAFRVSTDGKAVSGPPVLHSVRMRPGRYMLTTYNHNAQWEACLARATIAFDIRPGEASYIGHLDFAPVRESIFRLATAGGQEKTTHIYALNRYYDDIAGPRLATGAEVDVEAVRAIIGRVMPRMKVPIIAQTASLAQFGIGQAKPKSC